jgi:hypothetical protein
LRQTSRDIAVNHIIPVLVGVWRKNLSRLKIGKRFSGERYWSYQYTVICSANGEIE